MSVTMTGVGGTGFGSTGSPSSLKSAQIMAVERMLSFNEELSSVDSMMIPQWKVLLYDPVGRSIISPLLSVSQLRRTGVTLHLSLQGGGGGGGSEREPIPDVPAVYFVEPTRSNLTQIARDCAAGLYQRVHLNFIQKIPRPLMEELATLLVKHGGLDRVAGVHDQFLDYVCLEDSLFTLNKERSFVRQNQAGANQETIETAMEEVAYGLFCVVASLGVVPIIRCPRGGAPEMVARRLCTMITSHPTLLRGKQSNQHHRPLLVVLDRSADLVTPLQHCSTYQALVDDLLSHQANRVQFTVKPASTGDDDKKKRRGPPPKPVVKTIDLDADTDPFYANYKFSPFPEAIEQNGVELGQVSDKEQAVRSTTTSSSGGVENTLADAVDSLPALLERKRQLEVHTSILQAVMDSVAERDVPLFFERETALLSLSNASAASEIQTQTKAVGELLESPKGNLSDKLRLLAVYALCVPNPTAEQWDTLTSKLQTAAMAMTSSADSDDMAGSQRTMTTATVDANQQRKALDEGMRALAYLKRLTSLQSASYAQFSSPNRDDSAGGKHDNANDAFSSFMARAQTQATGLLAKATEKVSVLLSSQNRQCYATRVVENLCDKKPNTEDDTFLYLDPKAAKKEVDVTRLDRGIRGEVRQVVCFVVGGGCYSEYQNLYTSLSTHHDKKAKPSTSSSSSHTSHTAHLTLANDTSRRTLTYGCTELISPVNFLQHLSELG